MNMKNKLIILFSAVVVTLLSLNSCEKSYTSGGIQDVNIFSQKTNYEYLQSNPVFDTLIKCIDAAGLKDAVNAAGTYFAPTDYAILGYLGKRTIVAQRTNQYAKWGLDSLLNSITKNYKGVKDSLKMYLFTQKLTYDVLTGAGKYYTSGLANYSPIISYETSNSGSLGYNSNYSTYPRVVYFAHLYKPYALSETNPSSLIPSDVGSRVLITTSGINTKNGVVHVLSPTHSLFFNRYN
jgi:hypothetical protein